MYKLDWIKIVENEETFKILNDHLECLTWRSMMEYQFPMMRRHFEIFMIERKDIKKRKSNIHLLLCRYRKPMKYIEICLLKRNSYQKYSDKQLIVLLDYDTMREKCSIFKKELIQKAMHPSRIQKYLDQGISFEELDNYI